MTEDGGARVSSNDATVTNDASQTRQRKKRKWDQPAEAMVSAGFAVPFSNLGTLGGIPLPGVAPVTGTILSNPLAASCTAVSPVFQQHAAAVVPKQNQPKIQDELVIAREIVMNDAESSVRYKLTKRQTQEEIQRCTGAVVITRGKYRPPNAPPDGEKPLYLHISAGAHLKETAERILAVDRAAAMVEEMLKHGQSSQTGSASFMAAMINSVKVLSTCVYLGFDADPSLNVAARIRGPNDQYINHIMNETGATVILRGHGSGNFESLQGEETPQPLHLFLSSNNPKSLDDAKRLAENLLDTISVEFGASRTSSSKVYGAVPPPQQLLTGVQSSGSETNVNASSAAGLTSMAVTTPAPPVAITTGNSQGIVGGMPNSGPIQANAVGYPQPLVSRGTSYSGYGGIYPQATPLQQVALALRQSSPISSSVVPATSVASMGVPTTSVPSTVSKSNVSSTLQKEQQPPQKRKFQELPAGSKGPARPNQGSNSLIPSKPLGDLGVKNVSTTPSPKKSVHPSSNGMPSPRTFQPPPPKTMLPPPPPPKFTSSMPPGKSHDKNNIFSKAKLDTVPDTLVQLMAYGDEDDDSEESSDESLNRNSNPDAVRKPFWAL
ncbi:PREDICTED: protein RIK isoform X1 [Theobroma cacao]|uniref:Protein RIK n=1 Tax=Theobroma cacao TaxID=3641 RepID=A0AB32V9E0_THECC|nr:PREDICTED: protein RIK isoform X1 [Theobroma cacao]